ncbi:type II/IV secretion system protein [Candidatus Dojkabacteria bacterium]|uniref:Type II/IV secretion system protein n=1 Tax=Candidatus Dojkabacteria bacterium TaxID=2099670 RepID=A0A955LAF4_9BACT|nr:type II/IV secretion system protein [Candidatus Dojkabacteria bacterium]
MNTNNIDVLSILKKGSYITPQDAEKIEQSIKDTGVSAIEELTRLELVNKSILGQAISEYYGIPYWDLESKVPDDNLVSMLPERICDKYTAVVVSSNEKELTIALGNFEEYAELVKELKALFPTYTVHFVYSFKEDIRNVVEQKAKLLSNHIQEMFESKRVDIPELVHQIFKEAVALKTSDIHFEPSENDVLIRFRVDGVLQDAARFEKTAYHNVINRIKVLAKIRLDDHFSAQDGAIRTTIENEPVDLRVSIMPTLNDEKIVIRILTNYVQSLTLNGLGLRERDQNLLVEAAKKPFGMILVTGPTGSGKTTTLYSLLKFMKSKGINITTIEDPVEYKIPGINQIQVNNDTNLTFPKGLRAIVRQDPDVILVGEIRDKETVEIALNAALTGHLVLSTFHANDAATAIPRLLDMGAEPFLLASTLNLIISQRLVREIDSASKYSRELSQKDLKQYLPKPEQYFSSKTITVYEGKPSKSNNNTGFRGRTAIFETIYMTPEMQELTLKVPSNIEIRQLANAQGGETFFQDGIDKVIKGVTTIEELLRVAPVDNAITKIYEAGKTKK